MVIIESRYPRGVACHRPVLPLLVHRSTLASDEELSEDAGGCPGDHYPQSSPHHRHGSQPNKTPR